MHRAAFQPGAAGLQLWLALPEGARPAPARFEHHGVLPSAVYGNVAVTVVVGEFAAVWSPATAHTSLVIAEVTVTGTGHGITRAHSLRIRDLLR